MRILGDYRKYFQTGTFTVTMPDCLRHRCACAGTDRAARTGHSVCYAPDSEKQVRVVATKTFSEYSARIDKEERSTTSWNKWAILLGYGPIKRIIIWKHQSRSVSFDANLTLLPSGLLIQYYLDAAGLICHSEMISGPVYALFAGFLGAAASLSAKLSLGADYLRDMCETGISGWTQTPGDTAACDWLHIPLRLLCGALLFACNAIMWTFFSKALRHCSSSARATVTTTASNFISSAVLGRLIFGESHAALWWVGISLTLCGLLVLHASSAQTPPQEDKKDK